MKTFQEFIFEKYYEPDEKLPSGETPVEKATQKSRKRARTIGSQSPENQDRWAKQYDLTRTKVEHGADNPSLNTKVGHREKDEIEIDHDDKYMFLKHKPSGVSFDVEKSDESQYDDVRTIQWNHSQDKVKLSPKEKFKLARTAQKVWDTHVSPRLPNKSIVHNTPSSSYDNRGQPKPINRRSEIYKKAGFGSVDSDGDQFAEVGRPKSPKQIAKGKTRLKPLDPKRAKVEVEWGKEPDEYEEWEDQVNLSNFVYIKEGKTFSEFMLEAYIIVEEYKDLTPEKEERVQNKVGELVRDIQVQGERLKGLGKKPFGKYRPKVRQEKEAIIKSARNKQKLVQNASDALIRTSTSRSASLQKRIQGLTDRS